MEAKRDLILQKTDAKIFMMEVMNSIIVMTDWIVGGNLLLERGSRHGTPDAALVAASGHSLFMPGSRKDLREIMSGLKKGTVTREQLIENAGWLLHVIDRLGKQS